MDEGQVGMGTEGSCGGRKNEERERELRNMTEIDGHFKDDMEIYYSVNF